MPCDFPYINPGKSSGLKSLSVKGLAYMKKQGKGNTASIPISFQTGSSSVQVYHDYEKVVFNMHSGNGCAAENISHPRRDQLSSRASTHIPDINSISHEEKRSTKDETGHRSFMWMMDSSSQAYSGPEDNSTDPHETLTETSTLTFVDACTTEESAESHSLHGVGMVYLKEFVLIDDDEDGDMSLREKTVTDVSLMDGKAADLVCSRLLSTSSGSVSECKEESFAPDAPPPEEPEAAHEKKSCCLCTLL